MFKNLEAEMIRNEITKETIAQRLGVSPQTVSRKLNGSVSINITEAKIIKSLFSNDDFTIDFLFKLPGDKA